MRKSKVIYPGTFDPITVGHLDILERASRIFETVVIAVARDTKKNTLFSLEDRVEMIKSAIEESAIENVQVVPFNGLLIDFVNEIGASIIVRGLRASNDFEYEFQMSYINHKMNNDIETIFLPATANSHYISSTFVKEISRLGGDISQFVSRSVDVKLKEKWKSVS